MPCRFRYTLRGHSARHRSARLSLGGGSSAAACRRRIATAGLSPDTIAESALEEEGLGGGEEGSDACGINDDDSPERGVIAQILSNDTAKKDAKSHADVPRDQDGGISRAALVVVCHADGHVLESRPHVAITQADEQCRTIVANQSEKGSVKSEE